MAVRRHFPILIILLLASALRFQALAQDTRFHPDEALFATFARSAAVNGDWMLHGNLDKTPLSIYAVAEAMSLFGVTTLPNGVLTLDVHAGEFAARVPATFASLLTVALIYALAKRLYKGQRLVPLIAAALIVISPLALAFSATVFTDSLLLLCVMLALWTASLRKLVLSGVCLVLAFWCKQQALLVVPLVLALAYIAESGVAVSSRSKQAIGILLRVCLPLVFGVLLLFVWDASRGQLTSLWAQAVVNNDPGRLAYIDELVPRLLDWAQYGQYLVGSGVLGGFLAVLAIIAFSSRLRKRFNEGVGADTVLLVYTLGYLLLHWLVALNIYDRYLLLLLPPGLLLMARGLEWTVEWTRSRSALRLSASAKVAFAIFSLLALAVFLLLPALDAVEGRLPIGGQHGEYDGIDELGAYLDSKNLGAIIYDHWLTWELGYYIGTWSDKRRVYYPTPETLLADAVAQADPAPRYFIAPSDQRVSSWLDPLREAGFGISVDYESARFVVYELIPPRSAGFASTAGSS